MIVGFTMRYRDFFIANFFLYNREIHMRFEQSVV